MAEKILNTRILLKYDTLSNWNATTTYLRKGEVAIATVESGNTQEVNSVAVPQVLVKVGDGQHLFKDLPYITAKAGDVYAWAKKAGLDYNDLPSQLTDKITALEAAVGTGGSVATQIDNAIKAAIGNLDVDDAEVAGQFVVAVPEADGKVAPQRRALVATDIPELSKDKITGLTTALSDLNTAIGAEKDRAEKAEAQVLKDAKAYTDELANGAVKANTDAIAAINHETTGILATAKGYTDTKIGDLRTEVSEDATTKANQALTDAKAYTDAEIVKVNGVNAGLAQRVQTIENDYLKAADKTELQGNIDTVAGNLANEVKRAGDAEAALDARLDTVETFFEFASEEDKNLAYDTLKEIQDYIVSDQTGAANMLQSIQNNKAAIDVINSTDATKEGSLAKVAADAAKAVADEKTRAEAAELANKNAAAAAKSAADAAQADVDALEGKVGVVPADKTVVQMIAEAQTAATYDDSEVRGLITANGKAISDEVARAKAAEEANANNITAINTKIGTVASDTTVVAMINAVSGEVAAEKTRAEGVEADLLGKINTEATTARAAEKANADAITLINNDKTIVKSVEGDDVVKASIANNKLTIDFDDTLTFIFDCGTSAGLDAAAGV